MIRARLPTGLLALLLLYGAATARAGTSTAANPVVTFSTFGTFNVSLQACNYAGCSLPLSRTVTVLDPRPQITGASTDGIVLDAVSVRAGELLHLFGNGIGKPPLDFAWHVDSEPPSSTVLLLGPEAWWDTTGVAPGVYTVALYLSNGSGAVDTHLTPITVTVLPQLDLAFYTLAPCRIFDSRAGNGALVSGQTILVAADACGVPANARALAANITVVSPTASGKLNLYPGNYPAPGTAEVSFNAGAVRANQVVVGVSTAGAQTLAARAVMKAGATVHLVIDVSGYFAPAIP